MPPLVGPARVASAAFIGFCAGSTLGVVGWGGGQIIIPALTSPLMGLSQIAATGTSLTSLSFAATVGAGQFLLHDAAHVATAICIAFPSMLAARFGARLAGKLNSEVHALIFNGMSLVMIPTHFIVQHHRNNQKPISDTAKSLGDNSQSSAAVSFGTPNASVPNDKTGSALPSFKSFTLPPPEMMLSHACFGSICGVLSAVMGVGGLPFTISYLTLAVPQLPHHLVQGTAMVSVLPSVLTSAFIQAKAGHTPLSLAAAVCCGSIVGSAAGAKFALSLDENQLRYAFMASLVLLGGRSFIAAGFNVRRILQARRAAAASTHTTLPPLG